MAYDKQKQMVWVEGAYEPYAIKIGNGFLIYSEETSYDEDSDDYWTDYEYRGFIFGHEVSITWTDYFDCYSRKFSNIGVYVDGKSVGGCSFSKYSHTDFIDGLKYAISCAEQALGISQEMTLNEKIRYAGL